MHHDFIYLIFGLLLQIFDFILFKSTDILIVVKKQKDNVINNRNSNSTFMYSQNSIIVLVINMHTELYIYIYVTNMVFN